MDSEDRRYYWLNRTRLDLIKYLMGVEKVAALDSLGPEKIDYFSFHMHQIAHLLDIARPDFEKQLFVELADEPLISLIDDVGDRFTNASVGFKRRSEAGELDFLYLSRLRVETRSLIDAGRTITLGLEKMKAKLESREPIKPVEAVAHPARPPFAQFSERFIESVLAWTREPHASDIRCEFHFSVSDGKGRFQIIRLTYRNVSDTVQQAARRRFSRTTRCVLKAAPAALLGAIPVLVDQLLQSDWVTRFLGAGAWRRYRGNREP